MKKTFYIINAILFLFLVNCASMTSGDTVYRAAITGNDSALTPDILRSANLNVRNPEGNTALMWAVYYNFESIVAKLLKNGARVGYRDKANNTTLDIAKKYNPNPAIITALTVEYQKQLSCNTIWEKIKGILTLRECHDLNGKTSIEELDKFSKLSDGPETKIEQVTILKLLSQKEMKSNEALLKRKNMSEKDRIREYNEISSIYDSEGNSENNEIAKDKFDICKLNGKLELEDLLYEKNTKEEFNTKYKNSILLKDPDKEFWLSEHTKQYKIKSIEDTHKFLLLKEKINYYTAGISNDYERFFAYNDLANEKTIEKDYQRMASLLAQIVIYKVNNYFKKKESLTNCTFSGFALNDDVLKLIKEKATEYLNKLSQRVNNDKNAPLTAIHIKIMGKQPVENECRAILGDPPIKYESHRDLAQALTWCYAAINDPTLAESFLKRITELSDPVALREAERIKKDRDDGKEITLPSLIKSKKISNSLAGPQSQKYKLAVLTFIDQTQSQKGELVRYAVTDMLTSELYETHRFSLVDREDLIQIERNKTEENPDNSETEESKEEKQIDPKKQKPSKDKISQLPSRIKSNKGTELGSYDISTNYALRRTEIERENMRGRDIGIDGYLLGYITSIDLQRGTMDLDFRIVYPVNINRETHSNTVDSDTEKYIQSLRNLVVYGSTWTVKIKHDNTRDMINISRGDVQNMAVRIKQAFADTETINKNLAESAEFFPEDDEFTYATELNSSKKKSILQEINPKEKAKPSLKVMKIEGDKIIINAGSFHKVRSGLVGYVIDSADFGTYRYMARFVVEQVFEKSARCILLEGAENLSKEGQNVIIK